MIFDHRFRRKRRVTHKDPLRDESETGSFRSSDEASIMEEDDDEDDDYHRTDYKFEIPSFVVDSRGVPPSTHMWTREDTLPHIRKARREKEKDMLPTQDNLDYLKEFVHPAKIPEERPPSYDKLTPPLEQQSQGPSSTESAQDRPSTSAQADLLDKASSEKRSRKSSATSHIRTSSSAYGSDEETGDSPDVSYNASSSKATSNTDGTEGTPGGASAREGPKLVKKGKKKHGKGKPYVPLSKRLPKPEKPKIYKSNRPLKVNRSKLQEKLHEIAKQNEDKMYNPQGEIWRNLVVKIFPQDDSKNESEC